jgi:hypothetical protein
MTKAEYIRSRRESSLTRSDKRRELASRHGSIAEQIAAFYDSRRLTEEDVDAMAEMDTEARNHSRKNSTHE